MTTYLLHGGMTSQANPNNDQFFRQFSEAVDKPTVTMLLCYFARARNEWQTLSQRDTAMINKNTQKTIRIEIAENPPDLLRKIHGSDVLYVAGGEAERIEPVYRALFQLPSLLRNKVYAGSSMGAFMASQRYVLSLDNQDTTTVHSGLGLLPLQILCHWDAENHKQEKLTLLRSNSQLPILLIDECRFVTFSV